MVMVKSRDEYMEHKKADFLLVLFTNEEDFGSECISLKGMMKDFNSIGSRLHTSSQTCRLLLSCTM